MSDTEESRAVKAEAEVERLRNGVWKLAVRYALRDGTHRHVVADLRALLSDAS